MKGVFEITLLGLFLGVIIHKNEKRNKRYETSRSIREYLEYTRMYKSSLIVQKLWKKHMNRKIMNSNLIKTYWKKYMNRKNIKSNIIQKFWKKYINNKKNYYVINIQKFWINYKKNKCSIRIQRLWNRYKERMKVENYDIYSLINEEYYIPGFKKNDDWFLMDLK